MYSNQTTTLSVASMNIQLCTATKPQPCQLPTMHGMFVLSLICNILLFSDRKCVKNIVWGVVVINHSCGNDHLKSYSASLYCFDEMLNLKFVFLCITLSCGGGYVTILDRSETPPW
jgi:hypothetical protein